MADDREVPEDEGKALAQKWGCPGFETSAKTRVNVDEVFTELVRIVAASKSVDAPKEETSSEGCCVLL